MGTPQVQLDFLLSRIIFNCHAKLNSQLSLYDQAIKIEGQLNPI